MNRTENDLRAVYAEQPVAEDVELHVLDWLDGSGHLRATTRRSWANAAAAAVAAAALVVGIVAVLPHGADPTDASAEPSSTAFPARPAYRFTGFTPSGSLIPAGERKAAEPVVGPKLAGGQYSLSGDPGRVVVLAMFATWCGPCQTELAALQAMSRDRAESGVTVVGVDVKDATLDGSQAWLASKGVTFPVIWDQGGLVAAALGEIPLEGLPVTVLVDHQQRVAAVYVGMVTAAALRPVLDSLSAEPAGHQ